MSDIVFIVCGVVLFLGALLHGLAKSGPRQTLGGVIVAVSLVAMAVGGVLWSFGL